MSQVTSLSKKISIETILSNETQNIEKICALTHELQCFANKSEEYANISFAELQEYMIINSHLIILMQDLKLMGFACYSYKDKTLDINFLTLSKDIIQKGLLEKMLNAMKKEDVKKIVISAPLNSELKKFLKNLSCQIVKIES